MIKFSNIFVLHGVCISYTPPRLNPFFDASCKKKFATARPCGWAWLWSPALCFFTCAVRARCTTLRYGCVLYEECGRLTFHPHGKSFHTNWDSWPSGHALAAIINLVLSYIMSKKTQETESRTPCEGEINATMVCVGSVCNVSKVTRVCRSLQVSTLKPPNIHSQKLLHAQPGYYHCLFW